MSGQASAQFLEHLRRLSPAGPNDRTAIGDRTARLWELVDLPADTFANEAARFCGLDRVLLPDLLSATPAAGGRPRGAAYIMQLARNTTKIATHLRFATTFRAAADGTLKRRARDTLAGVPSAGLRR